MLTPSELSTAKELNTAATAVLYESADSAAGPCKPICTAVSKPLRRRSANER